MASCRTRKRKQQRLALKKRGRRRSLPLSPAMRFMLEDYLLRLNLHGRLLEMLQADDRRVSVEGKPYTYAIRTK